MKSLMGWLILSIIAAILLVGISVPLTYFTRTGWFRIIYVIVACLVVWIVYMGCFFFILYRPLDQCCTQYEDGVTPKGMFFLAEELNGINRAVEEMNSVHQAAKKDVKKLQRSKNINASRGGSDPQHGSPYSEPY